MTRRRDDETTTGPMMDQCGSPRMLFVRWTSQYNYIIGLDLGRSSSTSLYVPDGRRPCVKAGSKRYVSRCLYLLIMPA